MYVFRLNVQIIKINETRFEDVKINNSNKRQTNLKSNENNSNDEA